MTHTESQDLLLDLAYGELDPVRAQELAGHLAGCEECQREKAALDEARRLTAPLRELEEPSPAFDDRILAAARTQAQIDHDGSIGQVIEVQGNVRPLGLEAARIDAHAPVATRQERRKPRWAIRVALGGSVAAAATLALVVSTTLQTRQVEERARLAAETRKDDFQIKVPAQAPPPAAVAESEAMRDAHREPPPRVAQVRLEPDSAKRREQAPRKKDAASNEVANLRGSGGDSAPISADGPVAGQVGSRGPTDALSQPGAKDQAGATSQLGVMGQSGGGQAQAQSQGALEGKQSVAALKKAAPPPALKAEAAPPPPAKEEPKLAEVDPREEAAGKRAAAPKSAPAAVAVAAAPSAPAKQPEADDSSASGLEEQAQAARHAGNYALAASIYEMAAALRRDAGERSQAAWNLSHAVECYASLARVDDAFRIRDHLESTYPEEKTAISAAARATRSFQRPSKPAEAEPAPAKF